MHVAASYPKIKPSLTDDCILEGQNITLTCQVTYNGTNLMPLVIYWNKLRWDSSWLYRPYVSIRSVNTVNASSVHQATFTLMATAPTTYPYRCRVSFSHPTGLVLPGVQNQKKYTYHNYYTSSVFASRTVASKIIVYVQITDVV